MRLIDADAAIDAIKRAEALSRAYGYHAVIDAVEALPTVDAVPVVHGRWVHHPEIGWGSTCLCSECGEKTVETVMGEPRYKFCPNCGADMRGEE